ncbi:MAG: hypothetical protein EKK55_15640 [Rhodocyclaceae bacterium]|nr:MAG: hypothetical protein EKK55_15640 [Rhodocyclaceae bacterium]
MDWSAFGAIATGLASVLASVLAFIKLSDSVKRRERERDRERHDEALVNEQRHVATEHRLALLEAEFREIAEGIRQELLRTNEALKQNNTLLESALAEAMTALKIFARKRPVASPRK